jgi:hypothetical protein
MLGAGFRIMTICGGKEDFFLQLFTVSMSPVSNLFFSVYDFMEQIIS